MKKIILAIILLIPCCGWAQTNNDSLIIVKQQDYSIQYPATWRIDTSRTYPMIDLLIFSPKDSANDDFSENVNVVIEDLAGRNFTLDKYMELNETQIKKFSTNLNFIENKRLDKNGIAFHKFLFTSQQGIFILSTEQYYFISNSKAFIITLTTEEKKYNLYKAIGETILDSFKLNK